MTDREVDALIALAATTSKLAGRVATIDFAGTNEARGQLHVILTAMAGAMWRGATYDELVATLSTLHAERLELMPDPIEYEPTPVERPSGHPRKP